MIMKWKRREWNTNGNGVTVITKRTISNHASQMVDTRENNVMNVNVLHRSRMWVLHGYSVQFSNEMLMVSVVTSHYALYYAHNISIANIKLKKKAAYNAEDDLNARGRAGTVAAQSFNGKMARL